MTRKKRSPSWTGFGGRDNSRGYDSHNLGGHTTDHGDGTATTTDNRGSISHYSGRDRHSGSHTQRGGGNNGSSNGRQRGHVITKAEREATLARDQRARAMLSQASSLTIMRLSQKGYLQ
ncbi:hypothetical protein CBG25_00375 [Arsenophonus sp. ENCA]|uniref:hypothetical protein n=1 Tax=Arsenophonus sp. ENCA TaxID=1987579 RepID=UPI000BD4ACE3|nr:hypothetical protein [Arsenophonus sp. ENCA]PAV11577.1 hypothetical protein CBG25_00375 [Arsenophonus sp. ENCA]